MSRDGILIQVSVAHGVLVGALLVLLASTGLPVAGTALGGGLMAVSFVLIWGMARALVTGQRSALLPLLALMKITLYLCLIAAALTGRIVVDGFGFAAGVGCFLVATVAVALAAPRVESRVS